MKLTAKDREFLEKLKRLYNEGEVDISLKNDAQMCFVLRRNYGDQIESCFQMSRQGVRWRFQRLFSQIYIEAYEIIYWIESNFGTSLRRDVIEIVKQRVKLSRNAMKRYRP